MDKKVKKKIEELKKQILPVLKKYHIEHAGVFGSIVRGEDSPDSDIDILVKLPEDNDLSLLDFAGIEIELEEKLGRKVDLLTYDSIHNLLIEKILKEEIQIA
ncbi:MAG: nucleotidyltransferase family protein [Elusimicrobiota bacterium]